MGWTVIDSTVVYISDTVQQQRLSETEKNGTFINIEYMTQQLCQTAFTVAGHILNWQLSAELYMHVYICMVNVPKCGHIHGQG